MMRGLILGLLVLGGCVKDNPAWDDSVGDAGASGTTAAGGDASATSGPAAPPTSGGGETSGGATDSQGEPTTGALAATTGGTDTGDGSTGGGDSSTGAPAAVCTEVAQVRVELEDGALEDAGVVPSSMGAPCAWNGKEPDCGPLNFGKTGYFRLVNDPQRGKSAGLLRFDADKVAEFVKAQGIAAEDLLGARLELVVWEPVAGPTQDSALEISMLVGKEAHWDAGSRDATKAGDKESSANCRTREGNACVPWPKGDALLSSAPVGLLLVTVDAVAMTPDDGLPNQYHAKLRSEPLDPAFALALLDGQEPSLVVSLSSQRALNEGEIGIKLKESEWDDPALYLEVCTMWSR